MRDIDKAFIEKELTANDILGITETYRYYNLLDDDCKSRIPEVFKNFLNKYKDLNVGKPLQPEIPLEMQEISEEGWNLIAYMGIYLK